MLGPRFEAAAAAANPLSLFLQCDGCGGLLNPTELINPRCKFTGTKPVLRSTQHVFLDLPSLSQQLQHYITSTSVRLPTPPPPSLSLKNSDREN